MARLNGRQQQGAGFGARNCIHLIDGKLLADRSRLPQAQQWPQRDFAPITTGIAPESVTEIKSESVTTFIRISR